ncbi:MAG: alpha-amlyase [Balneola sp.]|nr:alpha-amlyase [Balneola sp.]|tara:strand:- start:67791 stop:70733 length:2943 start_codon:yes stop_codon:yes gene_type:complete
MKSFKFLSFIALLLFSGNTFAQVVTFQPDFPTEYDSLTVIFDATEGNGDLEDFDGDVYLYTGAITTNSTDDSNWLHVRPSGNNGWSSYPEELKATKLDDNKWGFTFKPDLRNFFDITDGGESIEKVAMLFRGTRTGSGDPVAVGRGDGGSDIFVEMFEDAVTARLLNPGESTSLLTVGDTLNISGVGNSPAETLELTLTINGNNVASSTDSDQLEYEFIPEETGNYIIELTASDGQGNTDIAHSKVVVIDGVELASRPQGLRDGIIYNSDGSVSLSLFAPGKETAFVIGDFSNWQADHDYLMKMDSLNADSVWFWINLDAGEFPQGQYSGFQYLVDEQIRISDPYSELILDPYNDQYISEATFPDLPEYPSNQTSGWVTLVHPGKADYDWQVTDFEKPDKDELIIYELLIRDFIEARNFQTLTDTLDYLENLGVNAIELMPVSEFDGNLSWGYNPNHHLALDKAYGTPEAFKQFVDEAHQRGMAVILDVVMNHASDVNPFFQLYGNDDDYYFNSQARHAYNVFNDFDHSYSGTRYYNQRMIEHWINEYKIDGFRWDLTKGFTQNCAGDGGSCTNNYQQDRVDVLKKYADWQWEEDPEFYVIFEHLGTESEEAEWANYRVHEGKGIMLWGKMTGPYSEAAMGYHDGGKSNLYGVLSESRSSFRQRHLVGYMESHDEQWMMFKNLNYGNSSGDYDITELGTALNRQKQAGAFFFLLPGPKMIWQFGELGYGGGPDECLKPGGGNGDCLASDPSRTGQKPIRWNYYQDEGRKNLYKVWSYIINLRKSSPAFTNSQEYDFDNLSGTMKFFTLQHEDSDVLVVGNFGVTETSITAPFPSTGEWHDYFGGSSVVTTESSSHQLTLQPGEFKIFTTREFETPAEDSLFTSNENVADTEMPSNYRLMQNYPNPFNPGTVISYQLADNSDVTLKVFDMLGREVAMLVNERKSAGSYQVNFDASKLSSGMYIYRLQAGGKVFTEKMMLIK